MSDSHGGTPKSALLRLLARVAAVLVFVGLVLALGLKVSTNADKQLIRLGEWIWPGYANELRMDPEKPDCVLEEIDAKLASCPDQPEGAAAAPATDGTADPFAGDDPFAEEGTPAAEQPAADPSAGDDPFAEEGTPAAEQPAADPFAGDDPFAEEGVTKAESAVSAQECISLRAFRDTCQARWTQYDTVNSRLTPNSRMYRDFEVSIADLGKFPYWKHLLVLLVVVGAAVTTIRRDAISLRKPRNRKEHAVAESTQLVSYGMLSASGAADYWVQITSEAENNAPEIALIWAIGFGVLSLINLINLLQPPEDEVATTSPVRLLMVVPLFAYMVILSGIYFWPIAQYPSGQAAYLSRFLQTPDVFLGIGLYLWAGMLFSVTRLATLSFNVLTPWRLPPALLGWLVVVLAAVPTAYSGASGIFVLAAGAVIFTQLRRAGATPRIALAATAMSGSLGVVLAPCLVVVLIAALNSDVTTSELYSGGLYVFALTAVLALIGFLLRNKDPFEPPPFKAALRGSAGALLGLLPAVSIGAVVILLYYFGLGVGLTENTAMYVLPAMLLVLVIYDRAIAPARVDGVELPRPKDGLWRPLVDATAESSTHIGGLLMLMIGSIGIGDIIERTEAVALIPATLGGPYITMLVLVFVMVIVGMTMDALGAVVLISISVAGLATQAGIHPVHFWLMVLCAFELGYLTPPVALNHLLARQVIGPPSHVEEDGTVGFVDKYEHIWLPMVVMATALILVAFGGFLFWPPLT